MFQFGLKPALARPGDHRAASSNGGKKGLHRRELPLSILQSKLAATQQRAPDALPGLALSLLATRGKDLALGMAMFFEIPVVDDSRSGTWSHSRRDRCPGSVPV
jgi:hypothetical protein